MAITDLTDLTKQVGQAIARRRAASGLTQEQVAEQLEIGVEAVSRIERGVVMPTVARLVEFAEVFQCNVSELLTEASPRSKDQAQHLHQMLSKLNGSDRALLVDTMERLVTRLSRR